MVALPRAKHHTWLRNPPGAIAGTAIREFHGETEAFRLARHAARRRQRHLTDTQLFKVKLTGTHQLNDHIYYE